jgi:hypothetical protein
MVDLNVHVVKLESIKPVSIPDKIEPTLTTNDSPKLTTISKTNGNTADDMLMEEMLLEEEQEQIPVKSIDLDNLTIPEISTKNTNNKDEPMKIIPIISVATTTTTITATTTTSTSSSITPSPTKKPYTLYKVPHTNHMTPPLSSRHKKQSIKDSTITRTSLNSYPFHMNKSFLFCFVL